MRRARATAHSNIALVKYWGKRDGVASDLNLPAVGSLSMTLGQLRTQTQLEPADDGRDSFTLDDVEGSATGPAAKVFRHLDRVWAAAGNEGPRPPCRVSSINHLPTAAGLASSASGFAALTVAAAGAFGLAPQPALTPELRDLLSALARQGSGSAARSLWGGFVRLDAGSADDGGDCRARPLFADRDPATPPWDLRLLVVHTARGAKKIGSTGGMKSSRDTSPYFPPWVATSLADLDTAEAALRSRDLEALGLVVEHSCFKMHACMLATVPPLMYWNGTSVEVIREVWSARESGGPRGFVTSDAGPHIKVLCLTADAEPLAARLAQVPGVHEVQAVAPGPDASLELL